jgi:multicomponent Na+:H+ antiporter subunit B
MEMLINTALLTMMAAITVGIARQRNLFGAIILAGIYSFLMASILMLLDAPDVAMTEAAVGAGASTVFLIAALHLTGSREQKTMKTPVVPLFLALGVGAALVWGTVGLSPFGSPDAPIHKHVAPTYLTNVRTDSGIPNVVTAILADYRSFDTLGETVVVFTGAIGVMLLLRGSGRRRREEREAAEGKGTSETGERT